MADAEWLASLKAGDKVAVWANSGDYSIATVEERNTRKNAVNQVFKVGNQWYDKRGGWRSGYTQWSIEPITPEIRAHIAQRRLRNLLRAAAQDLLDEARKSKHDAATLDMALSHARLALDALKPANPDPKEP